MLGVGAAQSVNGANVASGNGGDALVNVTTGGVGAIVGAVGSSVGGVGSAVHATAAGNAMTSSGEIADNVNGGATSLDDGNVVGIAASSHTSSVNLTSGGGSGIAATLVALAVGAGGASSSSSSSMNNAIGSSNIAATTMTSISVNNGSGGGGVSGAALTSTAVNASSLANAESGAIYDVDDGDEQAVLHLTLERDGWEFRDAFMLATGHLLKHKNCIGVVPGSNSVTPVVSIVA